MPNIKFNYLYRDAGNYKAFGAVVIANPENRSLTDLESSIREKMIDGFWFYAHEWGVPDLRGIIRETDPTWHEFESLAYTDDAPDYRSPLSW